MLIKPVSITSNAIVAIKEILKAKEIPDDYGLRIGLENMGASCGTTSYVLGFDKKDENDLAYEVDDIPVYIKKSVVLHVTGLTLDHVNEGEVTGFLFARDD